MRLLVVSQTLLLVASVMIAGPVAAVKPSPSPSATPAPTAEPTLAPTPEPTPAPTAEPTAEPTPAPTAEPTPAPTSEPTADPPVDPSVEPSADPSAAASESPLSSASPSASPDPGRKPAKPGDSRTSLLAASVSALDFDGTNDLVTFGAAPSLGLTTFTLELWFKREGAGVGVTTGTGGITSAIPLVTKGRGEGDTTANLNMNYFFGIDASTGRLAADFEDTTGGDNHPVAGTTIVTSNVWHHAAATYNGSTWNLYLDGALEGTLAVASSIPESSSIQHAGIATAMTSAGVPGAAGFFNGVIDEVRIWNVARSQAQIQADKNAELTSGTGLIGRWGMNEGTDTTVGNSIAGGVNGTATNGPLWVAGFDPAPVNNAPVAVADSYSTPQDTALVQAAPGVLSNDTDADSNPLTAVLNANVTHGTLALNPNGGFTYTPTAGYSGPDSFTYHANDGTANSNIVTVSLTVSAPLRGWWQFENNANDSSTFGNTGTLVGTPTFATGQTGQAISLNGTSQWASVPDDDTSLDLTTGMTLAAWIRPTDAAPDTQDLIKKADTTGTTVNGYELSLAVSGKVFVRLNNNVATRVDSTSDYPLNNTAWMHVAATFDGATIRLYINGVQQGSVASTTPITVNTLPLAIGAQSDNSRWFGGLMDDARVYATALSASQIAALATPPSAPVATADSYSTAQNTALVQPAPGVLSNDTDADSDPLTAVLNATVTHGTLSLNANGGFTYTPTAGYSGPDSFTYHANDGTADSNIVTVSLTVNAGATTSVSGVVSKSGGAGPLTGAYVTAYDSTTAAWINYGVTDAGGAYAINLPAGSYKLLVQTNTAGYPDTWHGGSTFANATTVVVDGAETVNITIAPNTSISGTVSKAGGAGPLVGSYVTAYDSTTAAWTNYGVTDAGGAYAINLPAGSYKLLVQTNTAGYPDTWHGGSTFANATTVVVDGAETVNITIAPNTSISGTVSKAGGAGPLVGSYVTAYDSTTAAWTNYGVTDAGGAYAINLPAGSYKLLVQTNTAGYPDTWHGGSTFANATTVVVDGAETVNITIAPNTSISGTVSKAGGAGPLVGSYVTAYDSTTAAWTNYGVTDAGGAYAINLPAGSYKLLVQTNTAGYPDTWHGGSTFANATTVVVDGAETVNITIAPNTSISGTVSKAGGAGPLVGSYVTAYDSTTAAWTNYGVTDAGGAYAINLPAGSYKLLVQTNTAGYPDTWHGGSTFANATTVVVDGAETVNITVSGTASTLRGWWTMDGDLTDSSGLANHASLSGSPGPTFVAGQVGQALSLNGSQNTSVPDANSLDLTTGMTFAAWIRPGVTVNTTQDVIKKATNGGVNGYELSLSSAGKVFVRLNQVASADTYPDQLHHRLSAQQHRLDARRRHL